jgi:hypothetical protein
MITRRTFLALAAVALPASALAGCGASTPAAQPPTSAPTATTAPTAPTAPTKLPSTSAPAAATEAPTLPAPTADTSAQAAVDESTAAPAEASRPVFLDFYAPW